MGLVMEARGQIAAYISGLCPWYTQQAEGWQVGV